MNSTQVTADINDPEKLKMLRNFLNIIAAIARDFRAKIIKNACDCLIVFYFPETTDSGNMSAFRDVLECWITMISSCCTLNTKL